MSTIPKKANPEKALINAAYDGRMDELGNLIERDGMDVNAIVESEVVNGEKTITPLLAAAAAGQVDIIKNLIERYDANIEIVCNVKRTPLMVAAQHGQTDALKLLLDTGANLKAIDVEGRTALHYAVLSGVIQTVQALLAAGVDYLIEDFNGETALDLAIKGATEEFINSVKRKSGGHFNQIVAFIGTKMQQHLKELLASGDAGNSDLIAENDVLKAEVAELKQRLQHPVDAEEKWTELAADAEAPTVFKGEEKKEDDEDGKGAMEAVGGSPGFVLKR